MENSLIMTKTLALVNCYSRRGSRLRSGSKDSASSDARRDFAQPGLQLPQLRDDITAVVRIDEDMEHVARRCFRDELLEIDGALHAVGRSMQKPERRCSLGVPHLTVAPIDRVAKELGL